MSDMASGVAGTGFGRKFSNPDAMAARGRPATGSKYPNRWYSLLRSGLAAKSGRGDGWAQFAAGVRIRRYVHVRKACRSAGLPVRKISGPGSYASGTGVFCFLLFGFAAI